MPPPPPEESIPLANTTQVPDSGSSSEIDSAFLGAQTTVLISYITVHIAGAVKSPGVYQFNLGARIDDGVIAAGGATTQADLDSVNLAMLLGEGQQIYIPKRNEKPHVVVQPRSFGGGTIADQKSAIDSVSAISVNINTASATELEQLSGVGPSTAKAIIAYREKNGGFKSVQDLLNVRGIGPAKLSQILPQARVG